MIDREAAVHELEAKEGLVLMEIIRDAGLPIEAASVAAQLVQPAMFMLIIAGNLN